MARKYKYQINSKRGIVKAVERPAGTTPIRESRGAYDSKATYSKGDTVIYNGLYYTATTGTGIPGEGDGWEISGIVSAKGVTLSIRLDKPVLDIIEGDKAVTATATATLGGQDITTGLPADGWRWTWRGKELSGEVERTITITDIPLEVGQYPVRVTHKLFGTYAEEQVVRVDVTSKLRAKLEADLKASEKKSKEAWEAYAAAKASKAGEDAVKAAKEYAEAQDAAYEERTKAYADKILTEKEQALIAAADAKANLAEKRAKAYADGKITETEQLAIDKAAAAYKAAVQKAKELDAEIQVGGRNLARANAISDDRVATVYIPIDCHVGETYTLSLEYMITPDDPATSRRICFNERTAEGKNIREIVWDKNVTADGKWHKWSYTFAITNAATVAIHGWALDCSSANGRVRGKTADARNVKLERGTVATDWTPAPEDVQAKIDRAKEQATKAQTSTDKLRGYVDGAYKDGIITEVESKTIATYINEVEAMWASAFGAYERVYQNALLTGTPKTALADAKITLAGAKDNLIGQIKRAISDGRATKAEATETDRLYNVYKGALRDFQRALKSAEESIRDATVGEVGSGSLNYFPVNAYSTDTNRAIWRLRLANGFFQAVPVGVEVPINIGYDVYFDNDRTDNKVKTTIFYTDQGDNYKDGSRRYIIVSETSGLKGRTWHHIWASGKVARLDKHVRIMGWLADTIDTGTYPSEVRNVYLRVGSRDLGWTPAPEDLQAAVDAERAARETAVRELESGLSSANSSISALQTAKREIEAGKLSASDLPAHLRWIYKAFNEGKTIKEGGLVLTQIIGLSNIDGKITAYISGRNAKGAHMLAAGVTSLADQDAVSYIDYDGTAKFGNIKINRDSIYIDADDSGSGVHRLVHDRLYITRSGIFAYLDHYITGGIGAGVFEANYEQGFHSKYVSLGGGGSNYIGGSNLTVDGDLDCHSVSPIRASGRVYIDGQTGRYPQSLTHETVSGKWCSSSNATRISESVVRIPIKSFGTISYLVFITAYDERSQAQSWGRVYKIINQTTTYFDVDMRSGMEGTFVAQLSIQYLVIC